MKRVQRNITIIIWVCSIVITIFANLMKFEKGFIISSSIAMYTVSICSTIVYFLRVPERVKAVTVLLSVGFGTLAASVVLGGNAGPFIVSYILLAMALLYFDFKVLVGYSSIYLTVCFIAYLANPSYIVGPHARSGLALFQLVTYAVMTLNLCVGTKYGADIMKKAITNEKDSQERAVIIEAQTEAAHANAVLLGENITVSDEKVKQLSEEARKANENIMELRQSEIKTIDIFHGLNEKINCSTEWIEENYELVERLKENYDIALDNVKESKAFSDNASSSMKEILTTIEHAYDSIERSSKETERIENIIQDINEIASQTNLLAINASIEAARVNNSSVGFDIVAEQIRVLSVQSKEASQNINRILETLSGTLDVTSSKVSNGREAIKNGIQNLNQMAQCIETIDLYSNQSQTILSQEASVFEQIKLEFADMVEKVESSMNMANENLRDLEVVADSIQSQTNRTMLVSDYLSGMDALSNEITNHFDKTTEE